MLHLRPDNVSQTSNMKWFWFTVSDNSCSKPSEIEFELGAAYQFQRPACFVFNGYVFNALIVPT